jgi:hypothetical protein
MTSWLSIVLASLLLVLIGSPALVPAPSAVQLAQAPAPAPKKAPGAEKQIEIATFVAGGAWYLIGGAYAEMINKRVPGVKVTPTPTRGALENIMNVINGDSEIAFAHPKDVYNSYNNRKGIPPVPANKNLRQLWSWGPAAYSHITAVALPNSGINSIVDMKGRRIYIGPPGSGGHSYAQMVLQAHGMTLKDITPGLAGLNDGIDALKNGTMEGAIFSLTTPAPAIAEVSRLRNLKFVPMSIEAEKRFTQEYPFFVRDTLTRKQYPSIPDEGVTALAYSTIVVALASLDEALVYNVTRAIWDNLPELAKVHPVGAGHNLEGAVSTPVVPWHPGSARYFKEKGVLK